MRRLASFDLKFPLLFIVAFVLQFSLSQLAATFNFSKDFAFYILILTYVLLLIGVLLNGKNRYVLVMGLGIFLNFLVIVLNGGMPVSLKAIERFGSPEVALRIEQLSDFIHVPMGGETVIGFLADVIPAPALFPFGMSLVSIGDILLSLGVFLFVQKQMVYVGKRRLKKKRVK